MTLIFINVCVGIDELNDPTLSLEESLADTARIDYYYSHLYYLQTAIKYVLWNKRGNFNFLSYFGVYSL
jgi:beta-glucosidase